MLNFSQLTSKPVLKNSHRDVKYSIGNIVTNIVTTAYGATWVPPHFRIISSVK